MTTAVRTEEFCASLTRGEIRQANEDAFRKAGFPETQIHRCLTLMDQMNVLTLKAGMSLKETFDFVRAQADRIDRGEVKQFDHDFLDGAAATDGITWTPAEFAKFLRTYVNHGEAMTIQVTVGARAN